MAINWREPFKFLAGAALAGAVVHGYLFVFEIPVPFGNGWITPRTLGVRACLLFVLCLVFLYAGYFRQPRSTARG
jgi:hypothetical protein